jgi:hypothetical protein
VLLTGTVNVLKGEHVIAKLERGSFFGEMSLIDRAPRSATIIANESARLSLTAQSRRRKRQRNRRREQSVEPAPAHPSPRESRTKRHHELFRRASRRRGRRALPPPP